MSWLEFPEVARILGGEKVLRQEINSYFDFIDLGNRGVPKSALQSLARYLHLSMGQMARLLPVSERTIQRHKTTKRVTSRIIPPATPHRPSDW